MRGILRGWRNIGGDIWLVIDDKKTLLLMEFKIQRHQCCKFQLIVELCTSLREHIRSYSPLRVGLLGVAKSYAQILGSKLWGTLQYRRNQNLATGKNLR